MLPGLSLPGMPSGLGDAVSSARADSGGTLASGALTFGPNYGVNLGPSRAQSIALAAVVGVLALALLLYRKG